MTTYLPVRLELEAPAVLRRPSGDPNSADTSNFIPGAALRGAVARVFEPDLRAIEMLILDHGVRYLNGYLELDQCRSIPTPVAWRRDKQHPGEMNNGTAVPDDFDLSAQANQLPDAATRAFADSFTTLGSEPTIAQPITVARVHNQRDPDKGRAWRDPVTDESHGSLFSYQAIAAGQTFIAMIAIDNESNVEELTGMFARAFSEPVLLGRSKFSEYGGLAKVTLGEPTDRELETYEDLEPVDEGSQLQILLISDYIGRDPATGEDDPTALVAELNTRLGQTVDVDCFRWSISEAGGYNRTWRCQLPNRRTLRAGSSMTITAGAPIGSDALAGIEHAGIGERRRDGFGRFVFRPVPVLSEIRIETHRMSRRPQPKPSTPVSMLARHVETALLDVAMAELLWTRAAVVASSAQVLPSGSLLARLRTPLRTRDRSSLDTVLAWVAEDDHADALARPARDQLERCRVTDEQRITSLRTWLRSACTEIDLDDETRRAVSECAVDDSDLVSLEQRAALDRWRVELIDSTLALMQTKVKTTTPDLGGVGDDD